MTQSMRAPGKVSRRAEAAGRAWITSPMRAEPDQQKARISHRRWPAQARQKIARRMVLRIADDGDANAEQRGEVAFGNRFGGVVGAFGVHVRLEFAQQRIHVELVENHHVVDAAERRDQRRPRAFGENGAAFAFQLPRARVGIDSHHENIALGARRLQIAHVAHVKQVEHAVGENDLAARAAMLVEHVVQAVAREDFFARVHSDRLLSLLDWRRNGTLPAKVLRCLRPDRGSEIPRDILLQTHEERSPRVGKSIAKRSPVFLLRCHPEASGFAPDGRISASEGSLFV